MIGKRWPDGLQFIRFPLVVLIFGAVNLVFSDTARSSDLDDALEAYLTEVCEPSTPPAGLELLCFTINAPGGDPDSFALISTGNLGSVSTQEDAATFIATQEQTVQIQSEEDSGQSKGASADFVGDRWGMRLAVQYSDIDRKTTALQQGYDAELNGASIGLDYLALAEAGLRLGATVAYATSDSEFDNNGGSLDVESVSGILHASYAPNTGIYGTIYGGYGRQQYEMQRSASFFGLPLAGELGGMASGSFDGDQTVAGLSVGYDELFDTLSVGPGSIGFFSRVNYAKSNIDSYSETGDAGLDDSALAMRFDSQIARSLTASVGARGSLAHWFLHPFVVSAELEYVHEFERDSRTIGSSLVAVPDATFVITTDPADQNYIRLGIGASARIGDSGRLFANYSRRFADSLLDIWSISCGLRVEF